jgi:biotin operon repressor
MNPYELPASIQPLPDRALLAAALAYHDRWIILKDLSKGEPRMTLELAQLIGKSADATAKQMFMLRRAGLAVQSHGRLYSIPKQYLPQPGQPIVDFGHCLLRLDAAK